MLREVLAAEGLRRLLGDDALRSQLRSAGPARAAIFDLERATRRHLEVYARLNGDAT